MNSIFFTKFGDEKTEDAEQAGLSFSTRQFWVRESGIALKVSISYSFTPVFSPFFLHKLLILKIILTIFSYG